MYKLREARGKLYNCCTEIIGKEDLDPKTLIALWQGYMWFDQFSIWQDMPEECRGEFYVPLRTITETWELVERALDGEEVNWEPDSTELACRVYASIRDYAEGDPEKYALCQACITGFLKDVLCV